LYCRRVSDAINKISCRLNPKKHQKKKEREKEGEGNESQQKKKEHFSITPQQQTNMRSQFQILHTCNEAVAATDAPEAAAAHSKLSTTTT
jgi:hypothetical protein